MGDAGRHTGQCQVNGTAEAIQRCDGNLGLASMAGFYGHRVRSSADGEVRVTSSLDDLQADLGRLGDIRSPIVVGITGASHRQRILTLGSISRNGDFQAGTHRRSYGWGDLAVGWGELGGGAAYGIEAAQHQAYLRVETARWLHCNLECP